MLGDRDRQITRFLQSAGWADATRRPLAGDASARRYERLSEGPGGRSCVFMDAPPARCPTTAAFVNIAGFLRIHGFSAPEILGADIPRGLLLLEDLGDDLFARMAHADPTAEPGLYDAATDFLIALHAIAPPHGLAVLDNAELSRMIGVTYEWYLPGPDAGRKSAAMQAMQTALDGLAPHRPVVALRDFHAENLIWLANRTGLARVGLLDFQDAFLGHPAYDLISLTRDARRDVSEEIAQRATARYVTATGCDRGALEHASAVLAAQRNLRILGVFARLARRDGKPDYLPLIPRVWAYLQRDLAHPGLEELRMILARDLPVPDSSFLQNLRDMRA